MKKFQVFFVIFVSSFYVGLTTAKGKKMCSRKLSPNKRLRRDTFYRKTKDLGDQLLNFGLTFRDDVIRSMALVVISFAYFVSVCFYETGNNTPPLKTRLCIMVCFALTIFMVLYVRSCLGNLLTIAPLPLCLSIRLCKTENKRFFKT